MFEHAINIELDDVMEYTANYIENADKVFKQLMKEIELEQHRIIVFGKEYDEPRLSAIYGDDINKKYIYGKRPRKINEMPKTIRKLRDILYQETGKKFDFVLVNYYRDGNDKVGWHSDNEKMIDTEAIASISLGAERTFRFRDKLTKKIVFKEQLKNGSLLLMKNNCQYELEHDLPADKSIMSPRLNLTFRKFK